MSSGIKLGHKVGSTRAMRKYGATVNQRVHPLCKQHEFDTDDYWRCSAAANTYTAYHPTSSCTMGARDDPKAVVDPRLRQTILHFFCV